MSLPTVVAVDPGSAAARAGLLPGDEIVTVSGRAPKDIIEYRLLVDEPDVDLDVRRGGLELSLVEVECISVDIDKHWTSSQARDGTRCRAESEW